MEQNITTMYCVHWLIIGWSRTILPLPLSLPWILRFVLLLAVTDLISVYYLKLKARVTDYIKNSAAGQRKRAKINRIKTIKGLV